MNAGQCGRTTLRALRSNQAMFTMHADTAPFLSDLSEHLAHEQRLQACRRALCLPGWQKRLTPLAQHMARQHLVRARGYARAPLRHLDVEVLREALGRMLRHDGE